MFYRAQPRGVPSASKTILETLSKWKYVETAPHRFGGIEYKVFGTEIGHTHGNRQADIRFNKKKRKELVEAGRANPHHILPDTGWISFYIQEEDDIVKAIGLFREAYEIILSRKAGSRSSTNPIQHERKA